MIRIIASNTKFCRISPLYKNLNLLKLTNLYNFELAKFFHLLVHDELPAEIYVNFTKFQQIHDHNTRRFKEIVSLDQNHILHRGTTKLWNEFDKEQCSRGNGTAAQNDVLRPLAPTCRDLPIACSMVRNLPVKISPTYM